MIKKTFILFLVTNIFYTIEASTTLQSRAVPKCTGYEKYPADSCYQYYECIFSGSTATLQTCPSGYAFDVGAVDCKAVYLVDCQQRTTTGKSSTTKAATTTTVAQTASPPKCTGYNKYSAQLCNQYYECILNGLTWVAQLQTCPDEYAFDLSTIECKAVYLVDCQNRGKTTTAHTTGTTTTSTKTPTTSTATTTPTTTTPVSKTTTTITVDPAITEPPCPGPGNHSAQNCYQYYQCVSVWWWYEPTLSSCQDGYAFDVASSECQVASSVDCQHRDSTPVPVTTTTASITTATTSTTTTTTPTTTTTTGAPAITEPPCPGPGNHSAQNCYQYYQCVSVWWWYEPTLSFCQDGYAFDIGSSVCQVASSVDCQHRDSTPAPVTTTRTSLVNGKSK